MKQSVTIPTEYRPWLENFKSRIRSAQIKAAVSVNEHLIKLYWELGQMINEKMGQADWGEEIIKHLSHDLKSEFPNLSGFSQDNLYFMLRFFRFYQNADAFVEQLVRQIPWGHNILIFNRHFRLSNSWNKNF